MSTDQINSNRVSRVLTPVIVQEDASSLNTVYLDSGHGNCDQMAKVHNKGSYYATLDGSVQFFAEPKVAFSLSTPVGRWWQTIAPSGKTIQLGEDTDTATGQQLQFGWFNRQ